jgi:allantoin racemase
MKILVINPNLTQAVTDAVADVARKYAAPGTEIVAVTGEFGPQVIGSRAENALAHHGVLELSAKHGSGCDAVVLGVSLDTGLLALRELLPVPVVGMTEAGLFGAALLATKIGVLTFGRRMVPAYEELVLAYGMSQRVVGVDSVELPPTATFSDPQAVNRLTLEACARLVDGHGAEAIVMAGAAMAGLNERLQAQVPVPLVDGVACAVPLAEMLVRLELPKPSVGSLAHPGARSVLGVSAALAAMFQAKR